MENIRFNSEDVGCTFLRNFLPNRHVAVSPLLYSCLITNFLNVKARFKNSLYSLDLTITREDICVLSTSYENKILGGRTLRNNLVYTFFVHSCTT